ncbi:MAG: tetratricopeptide repeat protein [Gammaproteobacteria bacterium]
MNPILKKTACNVEQSGKAILMAMVFLPNLLPAEIIAQTTSDTASAKPDKPIGRRIAQDPLRLQISKSKAPERTTVLVRQAYAAYRAGDLVTARGHYQALLQDYPDHRDALLGLAAVALRESGRDEAVAIYAHLLNLNPQDRIAYPALADLQGSGLAARDESAIKNRLFEQPDNPLLYFTLGRLYAVGQRWPDAQQAFFNAHRLAPANVAYALNLAISLDHLGQVQAALKYYRAALDLAGQDSDAIDGTAVRNRIQALSTQVQP